MLGESIWWGQKVRLPWSGWRTFKGIMLGFWSLLPWHWHSQERREEHTEHLLCGEQTRDTHIQDSILRKVSLPLLYRGGNKLMGGVACPPSPSLGEAGQDLNASLGASTSGGQGLIGAGPGWELSKGDNLVWLLGGTEEPSPRIVPSGPKSISIPETKVVQSGRLPSAVIPAAVLVWPRACEGLPCCLAGCGSSLDPARAHPCL